MVPSASGRVEMHQLSASEIVHREPFHFVVTAHAMREPEGHRWIPALARDLKVKVEDAEALVKLTNQVSTDLWTDLHARGDELFGDPTKSASVTIDIPDDWNQGILRIRRQRHWMDP